VGDARPERAPWTLVRVDAARVEAAIAASGLGVGRLSRRSGIDRGNLRRLRQRGTATWRTLQRLAEVLNVDPAALLAETEAPQP
jgi:hypothetical protein